MWMFLIFKKKQRDNVNTDSFLCRFNWTDKIVKCSTYSFPNFQLSFESILGDPEHLAWYFIKQSPLYLIHECPRISDTLTLYNDLTNLMIQHIKSAQPKIRCIHTPRSSALQSNKGKVFTWMLSRVRSTLGFCFLTIQLLVPACFTLRLGW